jgi:hypothetical protein
VGEGSIAIAFVHQVLLTMVMVNSPLLRIAPPGQEGLARSAGVVVQ